MDSTQLADLSRVLYSPVTLLLYCSAAIVCLYSLTTRAAVTTRDGAPAGARLQRLGLALSWAAVGAHIAHEVVRGLAQDRLPLGNMFEFTSAMALACALGGLIYLTMVRKRPELVGFVMLVSAVLVSSAMLTYADPGPLMPILDTWWRTFHVSVIVVAAGVLSIGFLFNGLHLLRDTADRGLERLARDGDGGAPVSPNRPGGGSMAALGEDDGGVATLAPEDDVAGHVYPDEDHVTHELPVADERRSMRAAINPVRLAAGTFLGTSTVSWVFIATPTTGLWDGLARFLAVNLTMVALALIARWFVPFLPKAATLDGLAYRTIALGFFAWTFGVIAGAMWAEQSWGRFWGWDPKETASFLTWIAYAAYLHARATKGTRGRGAGWIGLGAFAVLMFTYYAVNLVFVGLHSYAGLS